MGRRRAGTESRNKIIGFLFILLMIFGLIFCFDPPNAAALGDVILQKIGLKAWSNIDTGLHYTFIVAFVLYGIGLLGAAYYLTEFFPRFTKKLPLISIIFLALLPSMYSFSSRTVMSLSSGIDSVEYDTGEPQAFTLQPKEMRNLKVTFRATPEEGIKNLNGGTQNLDIIIYTDNEEKKFIN